MVPRKRLCYEEKLSEATKFNITMLSQMVVPELVGDFSLAGLGGTGGKRGSF